jgi:predicted N-formylglutamate amidohydrolase
VHDDQSLLAPDEPAAFPVEREDGRSSFFLTCDHAGALVPRKLNSPGVSTEDLRRHIAWDIGAAAVAVKLAARLAAFLILQTYSRLVIDCNRPPGSAESFVRLSETTGIPGNASVSAVDALAREREVFRQYQERIRTELDVRKAQHRHTMTPSLTSPHAALIAAPVESESTGTTRHRAGTRLSASGTAPPRAYRHRCSAHVGAV